MKGRALMTLATGLLATAGCLSHDLTGPSVSDAELASVQAALAGVYGLHVVAADSPVGAIDRTFSCFSGGTIHMVGSTTQTTTATTLTKTGSLSETLTDCKVPVDSATVFDLGGSTILNTFTTTHVNREFRTTMLFHLTGTIKWSPAQTQGSCFIDLQQSVDASGLSKFTGAMCGRSISP